MIYYVSSSAEQKTMASLSAQVVAGSSAFAQPAHSIKVASVMTLRHREQRGRLDMICNIRCCHMICPILYHVIRPPNGLKFNLQALVMKSLHKERAGARRPVVYCTVLRCAVLLCPVTL